MPTHSPALRALALILALAAPLAAQELPPAEPTAPIAPAAPVALPALALPSEAAAQQPEAVPDLATILRSAHPVVQAVMAGLAAMGFLVLTVLVYKTAEIARAQARLRQSFALVSAGRLGALAASLPRAEAGAAMVRLVEAELADLPEAIGAIEAEGLRERSRIGLARIEATALHGLRSGVGLLAQIAATAPFIGLFGTVFGIMNAFLAIAATKTTSLSVVAPGIAEALLATAVGLAAAIPAVLVYNLLTRRIAVFRHRLGDVAALTERLLSREIDRRRLAGARP